MDQSNSTLTSLTSDIVSAYVANNAITPDKLPEFIGSIHAALSKAAIGVIEAPKVELVPAVAIKKSVTNEYIICLEDGKRFKSLKRHLRTHYDLTPEDYRTKWDLPRDYPMVAPAYATARSNLAKSMGLGQRNGRSAPAAKAAKTGSKRVRA